MVSPQPNKTQQRREHIFRCYVCLQAGNTLWPRQTGRHIADDITNVIFLHEKYSILIRMDLKFVSKRLNDNDPTLVQIMGCRPIGDNPLSESMLV